VFLASHLFPLFRRIVGLHQITTIDSTDITDVWEPVEVGDLLFVATTNMTETLVRQMQEGLEKLETTRHVSSIQIHLSTKPLDTTAAGYQPPLPEDQVKPITYTGK